MDKLCVGEVKWILKNLHRYNDDLHAACVIIKIQQRYLTKMRKRLDDYDNRLSEYANST